MATIFSRIIAGEFPGVFVWRDARCAVFLSINPIAEGHALVVPIEEVDHWIDADDELAAHVFRVAHVVGRAQHAAFACERVAVIVAGFEVPHTHVHVIPANGMGDVSLANARSTPPGRDELERAAEMIRTELRRAGRPEVVAGS